MTSTTKSTRNPEIFKVNFALNFVTVLKEVRILTSFGAGDLGSEGDFLYSVMWVTKVIFQTI